MAAEETNSFDGEALAEYIATLFPMQQQAIATAQLAGCKFERRTYERWLGMSPYGTGGKFSKWIETTEYEVFLPNGISAGTGEDIYECALIALSILDTPTPADRANDAMALFQLDPENEQP